MRRRSPDLRTRAFLLLIAALGCAAYIIYRNSSGETALIAWVPLIACTMGAIHNFRRSRR